MITRIIDIRSFPSLLVIMLIAAGSIMFLPRLVVARTHAASLTQHCAIPLPLVRPNERAIPLPLARPKERAIPLPLVRPCKGDDSTAASSGHEQRADGSSM